MDVCLTRTRGRLHTGKIAPAGALSGTIDAVERLVGKSLRDASVPCACALLVGPRGSGKSLVVTAVLRRLGDGVKVVRLRGLLHAAPVVAFRAVARALGGSGSGGQQECLGEVGEAVKELRAGGVGLLFVLDDFERFASYAASGTTQQIVLYSLFNLLQDGMLKGACICMTTHIDVADALEKRVKSRFAHREIVMPMVETVDEVLAYLGKAVEVPARESAAESGNVEEDDTGDAGVLFKDVTTYLLESEALKRVVSRQFSRDRCMHPLLKAFDVALAAAFGDWQGNATVEARVRAANAAMAEVLGTRGSASEVMMGLSVLELALLVALRKVEALAALECAKEGKETKNSARGSGFVFADVYREYCSFGRGEGLHGKDGLQAMELNVAEKAWERLVEAGLVVRLGHGPKDMRHVILGVAPGDVDEALHEHARATRSMKIWGRGPKPATHMTKKRRHH